jgi:hypothetical protein
MRQYRSNVGKKEQRQFNQILDKAVKEGAEGKRHVLSRTAPKQHAFKGQKNK